MSLVKNSNEDLKCFFRFFVAVCNNNVNDLCKMSAIGGRIMIFFYFGTKKDPS